jgi:hypothetical protein
LIPIPASSSSQPIVISTAAESSTSDAIVLESISADEKTNQPIPIASTFNRIFQGTINLNELPEDGTELRAQLQLIEISPVSSEESTTINSQNSSITVTYKVRAQIILLYISTHCVPF